jgi:hypothetical protein
MSIATFKNVVSKLPVNISVLVRGDHGIGKSGIVRQLADSWGLQLIDRRISQMTEGDLIGLPKTAGEVTTWCPPDWYKDACDNPRVLFLDEINRGTNELEQACFQIILDRELNGHKLHPKTRVLSTINTAAIYKVNEMDPALLDRFFVVDLAPTVQEWKDWARAVGMFSLIVDFIGTEEKWLDPTKKNADVSAKDTSRRSWHRLSDALVYSGAADNVEGEEFFQICTGFVGLNAALAFHNYAKNHDNRVDPKDVLDNFTPKSKHAKKVAKLSQAELNALLEQVANLVVTTCDTVTDKQGKSLAAFMDVLPDELKISLWTELTKEGTKKVELAKSLHKFLVEKVLGVFGVPLGEKGINVQPRIPASLQPKQS